TYSSDKPIIAYGSVIDNLNNAGTYVAAATDSGGAAFTPPVSTARVYNVLERNFAIAVTPAIGPQDLRPGDVVTFHITVRDSNHGIELVDPNGVPLIPFTIFNQGDVVDKTFTITGNGTYQYFCVNSSCGTGHNSMSGQFVVGMESDPGPHYKVGHH